jgi:hypothetical protein
MALAQENAMADLIFQPLSSKWPKPISTKRRSSSWGITTQRVSEKLAQELAYLKVREAVVELDGAPADFRKLGTGLYADARLETPKVLVRFHLPEIGEVQYACDAFRKWQENLYAIGMTLERLRLIDSYEATIAGARQQYRGFKRLGSGSSEHSSEAVLTPEDAAKILVRHAYPLEARKWEVLTAMVLADAETMRLAARKAERSTHPDTGGNAADFAEVQKGKSILLMHHDTTEAATA